jgi:hypothetical protein
MNTVFKFAVIASPILLVACGGGGGGANQPRQRCMPLLLIFNRLTM